MCGMMTCFVSSPSRPVGTPQASAHERCVSTTRLRRPAPSLSRIRCKLSVSQERTSEPDPSKEDLPAPRWSCDSKERCLSSPQSWLCILFLGPLDMQYRVQRKAGGWQGKCLAGLLQQALVFCAGFCKERAKPPTLQVAWCSC